ncbi:hypothetical protein ACI2KT_28235 [Ensifer adhaerens]|uniref:hypothetical protein n=1 Tax=Ensifer TaxID=106591 RepID=UPI00177C9694|nr:hypothetical protein [Ensifer sp. ENS08]MBD9572758.1 hypothetical protein [Ensifer sp. ENS08]
MTDIMFTIRAGVSLKERARVLSRIQDIPGVELAAPIKRDTSNEALQRIHFARLAASSGVTECLSAIKEMPEVENASLPPRRGI